MTGSTQTSGLIELHHIGAERRPVLLIENFLPDPEVLRAEARGAAFQPFVRFFPGIQAPFPFERFEELSAPYANLFCDAFGLARLPPLIECGFALVTTPPDALAPLQRIPHIDTTDTARFAALAYISGAQFGGTAFYRHKSTGFEFLDRQRIADYNQALDRDIARFGVPAPRYISGDTDLFEMIAKFDAKPGRAIIYASNSLHSGWIQNAEFLTDDATRGRLTLNAFFGQNL